MRKLQYWRRVVESEIAAVDLFKADVYSVAYFGGIIKMTTPINVKEWIF